MTTTPLYLMLNVGEKLESGRSIAELASGGRGDYVTREDAEEVANSLINWSPSYGTWAKVEEEKEDERLLYFP